MKVGEYSISSIMQNLSVKLTRRKRTSPELEINGADLSTEIMR